MHVIEVRNVERALQAGLSYLQMHGLQRQSRNGAVLVAPGPVTTLYQRPTERVLVWPLRDANPFFHLMEALWMVGGRRDVATVAEFAARMREYSDDGANLHGAYGYRWREHHGFDQLARIAKRLRENPDDRRCVLQMWDARVDLGRDGKDFPCNTQVYFLRDGDGRLDMTLTCRSNDIIWGAYGANAVHFSVLQEYMAAKIGCPVGLFWQISNNFHAYEATLEKLRDQWTDRFPYETGEVWSWPVISLEDRSSEESFDLWETDLHRFLDGEQDLRHPFFTEVARPMRRAFRLHKGRDTEKALVVAQSVQDSDWRMATTEWLQRRV